MNIMKYRNLFFLISLFVLLPGCISLVLFGLKPSIDFTGGSILEIQIDQVENKETATPELLESSIQDIYQIGSVTQSDTSRYVIEGENIANETKVEALTVLQEKFGSVSELRFSTVGPTLSKELLTKTLTALVLVAGIITLYVWRQFDELKFGISAIIAMLHDSLVVLGSFSLLGHFFNIQVDVLFVTALLTTLSFSVHDTIVVYDRIRELRRKNRSMPFVELVNKAVVETLSRSINNSVTIIVMLASLSLLGGQSIQWFAIALLIGAITGTYSSTFTAAPLLLLWDDISHTYSQRKK